MEMREIWPEKKTVEHGSNSQQILPFTLIIIMQMMLICEARMKIKAINNYDFLSGMHEWFNPGDLMNGTKG